jgi:hypothetical protein
MKNGMFFHRLKLVEKERILQPTGRHLTKLCRTNCETNKKESTKLAHNNWNVDKNN